MFEIIDLNFLTVGTCFMHVRYVGTCFMHVRTKAKNGGAANVAAVGTCFMHVRILCMSVQKPRMAVHIFSSGGHNTHPYDFRFVFRTCIKQVPTTFGAFQPRRLLMPVCPYKSQEWRCSKRCDCRGGSCARP